jgi:hypothetical protein
MPSKLRFPRLWIVASLGAMVGSPVSIASDARPGILGRAGSYEVHASSPGEIDEVSAALEVATRRMETLFDWPTPRIAVVVFDSVGDMYSYDAAELLSRGLIYVPWIGPRLSAAAEGDVAAGRSRISGEVLGRWGLSHEAGHALLGARLREEVEGEWKGRPLRDGGGRLHASNLVPAWFEEAVASWCEPPDSRLARMQRLRQDLDAAIPLWRLFSMQRPEMPDHWDPLDASPNSDEMFSDESLAVASFLIRVEGREFAPRLLEGMLRGRATTQVLKDAEFLPTDIEALQAMWEAWMRTRVPAAAPGRCRAVANRSARPPLPVSGPRAVSQRPRSGA